MKSDLEPVIFRKIYEIISLSIIDIKNINEIQSENGLISIPYKTIQAPDKIKTFSFGVNLDKLDHNFKYLLSADISGNAEIIIDGIPDQAIDAGHNYTMFDNPANKFILNIGTRELFGRHAWSLEINSICILTINYNLFKVGMELLQLYNFVTTLEMKSKNKILNYMFSVLSGVFESPNMKQFIGLNCIMGNEKDKPESVDFLSDVYGYPILNNDIDDFKMKNIDSNKYNKIFNYINNIINLNVASKIDSTDNKIFIFGHCHIDVAWLWPYSETTRKIERSFLNVLKLYNMGFNFTFAQSTALYYHEIGKNNIKIFNKIKELIKENKWIPVGGMWVESDTNLVRGESLARQLLYGQKYFMENFGKYVKIGWLPDSFGFSGQLPQLFIKSGIESFVTHKPMWNDTTEFPFHCFQWTGIDGTSIITNIVNSTYNGDLNFNSIINSWKIFKNKDLPMTYLYGYGDGGGGPNIEMMIKLDAIKKVKFLPKIISTFTEEMYINNLLKLKNKMPVYNGEIYLENHRGVYTTNFEIKKYVAMLEDKINMLDFIDSINYISAPSTYKKKNMQDLWYTLLKAEFHDILPGSAYLYAYAEMYKELEDLNKKLDNIIDLSVKCLTNNKNIKYGVIGINTSQYDFNGYIEIPEIYGNLLKGLSVNAGNRKFIKCSIPGFGFLNIKEDAKNGINDENKVEINYINKQYEINNGLIKLNISLDGSMSFFYSNKKIIKKGNLIRIYNDLPANFDAWNINKANIAKDNYMECKRTEIKIISKNIIGIIEIKKIFDDNSIILQNIIIKPDSDIIEFENKIKLNNREKLVKVLFWPDFNAEFIKREIPFGNISTKLDRQNEKTHFEFPALRWVDYNNNERGFSIISRESHGYSFINKRLGISIAKLPVYPNPFSDRYEFKEKFYVCLHNAGEFNIYKNANFIFNRIEMYHNENSNGKNITGKFMDLMELENNRIILESLKKSENENGIIARLYNSSDKIAYSEIKNNNTKIYETDILEDKQKAITDNKIQFNPFEIKTLFLKMNLKN